MTMRLLPEPKKLRRLGGVLVLKRPDGTGQVRRDIVPAGPPEGYELTIDRSGVRLIGHDAAGLFYGQQTFRQLLRQYGRRLPCLRIEDAPAFRHRGYSLDISRGRVPKLATIKTLVDRLAALKMNQLQLYIEHVFDFGFDPAIGAGADPLTAKEIRELDRFCLDRHVELAPSLACFGHMGRILSLPRYRALAEVEWPFRDWESAPWRARLRGATLNPRLEAGRRLLRNMLDEYLPLFSSERFNMCGDETYDLGRGANAAFVRRRGLAALYLEHLRFVRRVAREHGKRLMFWGDVMQQHPEGIPGIPADCIALDWGYSWHTDFEKARQFIEAGLETYVCPSTRGYKVVFNEVEEARANIAGYARTGFRLGAAGLLVTDWGDMGHFNLPACSFHGLALGAAMGWNPRGDGGRGFDRAFSLQALGDPSGRAAGLFVKAGTTRLAEWPLLIREPGGESRPAATLQRAIRLAPACRNWSRRFAALRPTDWLRETDIEELAIAGEALYLNARRIILEQGLAGARGKPAFLRRRIAVFIRELEAFFRRYAKGWKRTSRPAGLKDLARAFGQVSRQWRRLAEKARDS
ncbi:MAG: beta-N-acetylhexosaminidase [Verrucomicrobia bacterium]|nr:beta-N-acetylhexosaminidase [Verrucomicrobiota bacterium]